MTARDHRRLSTGDCCVLSHTTLTDPGWLLRRACLDDLLPYHGHPVHRVAVAGAGAWTRWRTCIRRRGRGPRRFTAVAASADPPVPYGVVFAVRRSCPPRLRPSPRPPRNHDRRRRTQGAPAMGATTARRQAFRPIAPLAPCDGAAAARGQPRPADGDPSVTSCRTARGSSGARPEAAPAAGGAPSSPGARLVPLPLLDRAGAPAGDVVPVHGMNGGPRGLPSSRTAACFAPVHPSARCRWRRLRFAGARITPPTARGATPCTRRRCSTEIAFPNACQQPGDYRSSFHFDAAT